MKRTCPESDADETYTYNYKVVLYGVYGLEPTVLGPLPISMTGGIQGQQVKRELIRRHESALRVEHRNIMSWDLFHMNGSFKQPIHDNDSIPPPIGGSDYFLMVHPKDYIEEKPNQSDDMAAMNVKPTNINN